METPYLRHILPAGSRKLDPATTIDSSGLTATEEFPSLKRLFARHAEVGFSDIETNVGETTALTSEKFQTVYASSLVLPQPLAEAEAGQALGYGTDLFGTAVADAGRRIVIAANQYLRFKALLKQWKHTRDPFASGVENFMLPAYQEIIGMGPDAIPLLLKELQSDPDHWFWALRAITTVDPVLPEHRGSLDKMSSDWINWGRRKGHI